MSSTGNYRQQEKSGQRRSRSRRSNRGHPSFGMDEFGIIRGDDHSRSSDSVPLDDPSLNLTDDDTSARILETGTSENESPPTQGSKDGIIGATTSDSEAVLDISAPSGHISSDLHLQIEELATDITEASEDISRASDSQLKPNEPARLHVPQSPQQDETESLTEFEEIERLIQANTVEDSDDNLSDIPVDIEQIIRSRRVSRESTRSSKASHRRQTSSESEKSGIVPTTSDARQSPREHEDNFQDLDQTTPKLPTLHQDTGYASEGHNSTTLVDQDVTEQSVISQPSQQHYASEHDSSQSDNPEGLHSENDEPMHSTGLSTRESLSNLYEAQLTTDDANACDSHHESDHMNETQDDPDLTLDHFMIPTQRSDTNQPNSLVATFGTTEDFEALLKRQLDESEHEDMIDGTLHPDEHQMRQSHRERRSIDFSLDAERERSNLTSTKRKRLPEEPSNRPPSRGKSPTSNGVRESPRSSGANFIPPGKTKLKLSQKNSPRESPRTSNKSRHDKLRSTGHRSTRSPAASRARRANNAAHGRSSWSTLHRESSDDLSVRSDMTQSELRSRLKQEAQTRKRDEEFVKELKSNYDALLMKYAQAENTIDHLRLGAKINLFASVPRPNIEAPTLPYHEADVLRNDTQPQQAETSGMYGDNDTNFHHSRMPSAGSDSLVESSLQLPAAATKEFLKVALQLQAKDVQDKVESFHMLLKETNLSPTEQQQVMDNIDESMRNLERDYLSAIDEHATEQRQVCIATGGSIDQSEAFDPDRTMEADILRLGQMVRELRDHVATQTDPMSSRSPPITSSRSNVGVQRSNVNDLPNSSYSDVPSSPDADVDEKFNQLLHKYNRSAPADDSTNTPSMHELQTDESTFEEQASPNGQIPNRYLEPHSTEHDTTNVSLHENSPRPEQSSPPQSQTRRTRYRSSLSSLNESMTSPSPSPTRKLSSKLPRPISKAGKDRKRSSPGDVRKSSQTADKGTDSGFVGSESSRQSAAPLEPAKVKLVTRPPAAVDVTKTTDSTPPRPAERRGRPSSRASSSTLRSDDRHHTKQPTPPANSTSYIDRVGIYQPPTSSYTVDDSIDDISTTSTVREMLRPQSRSYSSSPPPVSPPTKPHLTGFPRVSKSGTSVKSRDSGRRSVASSAKDSTLDMIRGEISRLREEIKAAKKPEKVQPIHTSTPRFPLVERNSALSASDNEALKAIHSDIKALKDEVQKQGRKKKGENPSDTYSVKSGDAVTTGRRSRSEREGSTRGRNTRRSRSLGRDDLSELSTNRNDSSPETQGRRRRRSRSQERRGPWSGGYWTYVAPAAPVWATASAPVGRTYTRAAPPVQTMVAPPPPTIYSVPPVVHATPIIGPPSNVVYMEPQVAASPGRVYVQSSPRTRIYATPSKPQAAVYISPKRSASPRRNVRKANIYIVDSDDEQPLRRSHLSSLKRSSSMSHLRREPTLVALPDSRLNDSIERAERSAEQLRAQSRSMYKSTRDSLYRAQLLADTM